MYTSAAAWAALLTRLSEVCLGEMAPGDQLVTRRTSFQSASTYKYLAVSLCCLILASYTVDAISSGFPPSSIQAEVDIDLFLFVIPECVRMSSNQMKKLCGVIYSSSCRRFISQKGELLRSIDEKYNMFYI